MYDLNLSSFCVQNGQAHFYGKWYKASKLWTICCIQNRTQFELKYPVSGNQL